MTLAPFLFMLGAGASIAFLLGLAVTAAHYRPLPKRTGFEVRYER
ncbi:hypothetical protein OOJ09_12690 [Mesorhizobium qingshengii]|uniref:Uncharacterized protein n=1 Tax=Mesorhizobium qingshengii TaxID=1165689 RepID=A0ABT4QU17_9HYPH|nr:hypothetical protein [Mesorhizobium qingshengii]MCZ8545043.1 hypothetical protein [Mesorhizobium qingshengii]